jgi:hypothetical protein
MVSRTVQDSVSHVMSRYNNVTREFLNGISVSTFPSNNNYGILALLSQHSVLNDDMVSKPIMARRLAHRLRKQRP